MEQGRAADAPARLAPLTTVIGGASSGKSAHAEGLVLASGLVPVYLATAAAGDAEMAARIAAHRRRRGDRWRTIEVTDEAAAALAGVAPGEAVLFDCATLWLSARMAEGADLVAATGRLLAALAGCAGPVVVVTNETGAGIVPGNALARRFRVAQGELNQRLAAASARVVLVVAGLPLVLKDMPG